MPMFKNSMIILLIIVVCGIIGTGYGYFTSDDVKQLDAATLSADEATTQTIYVYVTGAVNKPGIVELEGSNLRMADAINACGGLLPTADVDNFNMAESIEDGQHIRVPEKVVAKIMDSADNSSGNTSTDGIININTASIEELDKLPGIGPAMAQRIIDYRQNHGSFKSIDEIQNVRGIGAKKFENLKDKIRI